MAFYVYLDVLAVHYLYTTNAWVYDQYYIWGFVHLQRFEFVIDENLAIIAILDENTMLHLDLTRTEGYFLVWDISHKPV